MFWRLWGCCLICLGLLACDRRGREPESTRSSKTDAATCDQVALAKLAVDLSDATPKAQASLVAEGLVSACTGSLPPTVLHYLGEATTPAGGRSPGPGEDAIFRAAQKRVCSERAELDRRISVAPSREHASIAYEVCDYARFDLVSAEEAGEMGGNGWFTWTTHQMLLDAETPPEVAKPISRAIMVFEQVAFSPQRFVLADGHRLAVVPHGQPVRSGIPIYLSTTEIRVNESTLVTLKDGHLNARDVKHHLVAALFDAMTEAADKGRRAAARSGKEWDGRSIVVVDPEVPFITLVDVMYTAGKAEFSDYDLLVETVFPRKRAIPISPPKYMGGQGVRSLNVFVLAEGYRVSKSGGERSTAIPKLDPEGTTLEAWDTEALFREASQMLAADPELIQAVITAENDIRFGVYAGTVSTLMGGACATEQDCLFSNVLIEAGAG